MKVWFAVRICIKTKYSKTSLSGHLINNTMHFITTAKTNTRFVRVFAWLHRYSNTKRVFGCTVNKFSALLPAYFVINYKFKGISVIK